MVRARRRLRSKLRRKSCSCPRKDDSAGGSSSTSIADSEYWPTEEVDEEEVIRIEVDDGSKELLLKDGGAKGKKWSRVKRIVAALAKIPWLGKGTVRGDILLCLPLSFSLPYSIFLEREKEREMTRSFYF